MKLSSSLLAASRGVASFAPNPARLTSKAGSSSRIMSPLSVPIPRPRLRLRSDPALPTDARDELLGLAGKEADRLPGESNVGMLPYADKRDKARARERDGRRITGDPPDVLGGSMLPIVVDGETGDRGGEEGVTLGDCYTSRAG
jgi:hypothetical protein